MKKEDKITNPFTQILDFAISEEDYFFNFYKNLSSKMKNKQEKDILMEIAQQEKEHKDKILGIKQLIMTISDNTSFNVISKALETYKHKDKKEFKDIFEMIDFAIQNEILSKNLYSSLAEKSPSGETQKILFGLAIQENKHKMKLEEIKKRVEDESKR